MVVTRNELSSPGHDSAGPVLRLVQVSDLHLQQMSGHTRKIAKAINRLKPHVIFFTGDMIDKRDRVAQLRAFLSLIEPGPRKFATLGNWEHWAQVDLDELNEAYVQSGCHLLNNESVVVHYGGREILITGVDDWTGGRPDLSVALKAFSPHPNHVVLAHSPVFRDLLRDVPPPANPPIQGAATFDASRYSIACVLSGHTHGGQINLFGWAPVRPAGSGPYVSGWYHDAGKPPLYVSRGLGTSLAPIRLGASPELAFFEWRLAL